MKVNKLRELAEKRDVVILRLGALPFRLEDAKRNGFKCRKFYEVLCPHCDTLNTADAPRDKVTCCYCGTDIQGDMFEPFVEVTRRWIPRPKKQKRRRRY